MAKQPFGEAALRDSRDDSAPSLAESVQFWCRNDFLLVNSLLMNDRDGFRRLTPLCYNDNRGVLMEFEQGTRTIGGDSDLRWIEMLKKRLPEDPPTEAFFEKAAETAQRDASNLLRAMRPIENERTVYRYAEFAQDNARSGTFPYAYQYKTLTLAVNRTVDLAIISSAYTAPHFNAEAEDCVCYRIRLPEGSLALALNPFEFHNEADEILLPPMTCTVTNLETADCPERCRAVIDLTCLSQTLPAPLWDAAIR